jgi:hypothetical protein
VASRHFGFSHATRDGRIPSRGIDVIAWPADYLSLSLPSEWVKPNEALSEGLRRVDFGAKEWIGLLAYLSPTGRVSFSRAPNSTTTTER